MNELDKIFRSKLENHTAEYSPQSWDKIQARLNNSKTNPRKLPWLWMSLIAGALIIGALYYLLSTDSSEKGKATKVDTTADSRSSYDAGKSDAIADMGTTSGYRDGYEGDSSERNIPAQEDTSMPFQNNGDHTNDIDAIDNNSEENIVSNASDVVAHSGIVKSTNSKKQSLERNTTPENRVLSKDENSRIHSKNTIDNKNTHLNATTDHETAVSLTTLDINAQNSNINNPAAMLNVSKSIDIRPIRTIGVSTFTKLKSENKDEYLALSKAMMDEYRQDCPSFVTDRTGVYLDFYISHEMPFSSLSAMTPEQTAYQALREETEGPTYSFSAGARLTLMLPNGLGLKTGLNYSQMQEKFSYVDPESVQTKEVITKTTIGGVETIDTSFIIIPGTRDVVSTNKYRSLDIPLLLSYEWDVRERTYMTVNGGVYLNLLFKESGKILDEGSEVRDLQDTSGDKLAIFKNNLGLSLFGSVGLHYRWNSNIDFILEPNIRLLVKSATVDDYSLEHKWFTAGLITGVRYNF